ncbi:peptide chain release factor 1 [SAR86 cluster bacterium]|jgi:peptide chain release factor 1|nr:peptide chain release factor 1 [SAR86 cluster bacterium]|tara:strand:- start:239 stop:1330 length:1092 start_codon:yes stop_codon:yes gene_type:complete
MLDSIKTRLTEIKDNFSDIQTKLSMPDVINDQKQYASLSKEYSNLKPIVEKFEEYIQCESNISSAEEVLNESDIDLAELAKEEIKENNERISEIEIELKNLLIPVDENDDKNVFVEVRAGTGGDEAALFVGDLYRMYLRLAERNRWKSDLISSRESEQGGFKEVVIKISGENVYKKLKFESGIHRVQRVPSTESQGRIHTSACSVAVLAEIEDVEEVEIDKSEIRTDTFRASGAGGQHVNKTDSAVRLTHIPTGIVVECQDDRSQHKNKAKALTLLGAKLKAMAEQELTQEQAEKRKNMVGSGDRSEKIRTYNFPQSRITDHRIEFSVHNLDGFLDGEMEIMISTLLEENQARLLSNLEKTFS